MDCFNKPTTHQHEITIEGNQGGCSKAGQGGSKAEHYLKGEFKFQRKWAEQGGVWVLKKMKEEVKFGFQKIKQDER